MKKVKPKKSKKWFFVIFGIIFFFIITYFGIYLYAKMQPKLPITGANGYHLYDINGDVYTASSNKSVDLKDISKDLIGGLNIPIIYLLDTKLNSSRKILLSVLLYIIYIIV